MTKARYRYPGDPEAEVTLLTGAEFLALFPERNIMITWTGCVAPDVIPVDDVVCDGCNAEVGAEDFCALTEDRLYCAPCYAQWIKPHLLVGARGEAP